MRTPHPPMASVDEETDSSRGLHAAARLFREEYDRINRVAYAGALPPFPGVDIVDRTDVFSMTQSRGAGPGRHLRPFLLSRHVAGPLLLEAIRHEIAHAAAILFDEDEGHGPAWQRHARLVGASGETTLDEGHPLRSSWPRP
jgi:SprT-like family protein